MLRITLGAASNHRRLDRAGKAPAQPIDARGLFMRWLGGSLALPVLVIACGCPSNSRPPEADPPASTDGSSDGSSDESAVGENVNPTSREVGSTPSGPVALVANMQAAYANTTAYSDDGVLNWQYTEGDTWQPIRAEFSTQFVRPNKLALRVRGLNLVSDGKVLRAVVKDEATDDYDGQMLERRSPATLQLGDLYSDVEIGNMLGDAIVDGTPWPLRLLTNDPALRAFLMGDIGSMQDQKIGDQTYRRVRIRYEDRAATLWIHPETFLLRRVELPAPDATFGVRGFIAEYANAAIGDAAHPKPTAFRLEQPAAAKVVSFFVAPPIADDLPSPIFGTAVGKFEMETADGRTVKREDFAGQTTVFVWILENEASKVTLQQLQKVAEGLEGENAARIFAVSPLPEAVTSESITELLRTWNVSIPLLRDTKGVGREFDVPGAPTVIVLDGQHRVQGFGAGSDPHLGEQLPQLLKQLRAGENPAGELRRMVAQEAALYRQQLAAAKSDSSSTVLELSETPLADASPPHRLKLTKIWSSEQVKQPGNILVVDRKNGAPRIFVLDHAQNWRTIVELDAQGALVKRRELPVPNNAAIAVLKSIVDQNGRRWYVGGARLAKQVYVFNDQFELAFGYPDASARHDGIGDFALINFQDTGPPQLCVGFWGVLGTHGVDLSGERVWTNRTAAPVIALAQSPPNEASWRQILATTDRGAIVPINGFGRNDPAQRLENHAITQLLPSPFRGENATAFMGMGVQANGAPMAVALSSDFDVLWDVPLPPGVHRNQIQPVTTGQLLVGGPGEWVFANADGTIGIVSDDLSAYDSFATGERLSGVAVAVWEGNHVLLISTPAGVTAWKVELPLSQP